MECPICKNRIGFNAGTCVECGFNYLSNEFEFIRVYVSDLKRVLETDIVSILINKHEEFKTR